MEFRRVLFRSVELVEADGEVEGKVLARIQRQLAGPAHLAARAIDSAKLGERHPLLRYVCQEGEIVKDGTHLQVLVATLREGDAAIRFGRAKRAAYADPNPRPAIQAVLRQRHDHQRRLDVTTPVEASGNWPPRRHPDGTVPRPPP